MGPKHTKASRSIRNRCVSCRKGRVLGELTEEHLDASRKMLEFDFFGALTVEIGQKSEKNMVLSVRISNMDRGAYGSGIHFRNRE